MKCTRGVQKCRDTRLRMKPVANHMKQAWRGCERLNGKQQDQFCDDFGSCPLRWTVRERQSPWVIVLASFNKGIDAKNLCGRREVLDASLGKKVPAKAFRGYVKSPEREVEAGVGGGGLDSAVSGGVSVNQGRGVDRNARQVEGSTSEDWSSGTVLDGGSARTVGVERDVQAFDKRSALRESLLLSWTVGTHQALRMCEDRQVGVDVSEVSDVFWDSWRPVAEVEVGLRAVFAERR